MEIPKIQVSNVDIRNITVPYIPPWMNNAQTPVAPGHPSVTEYIGRPIVDMPGCVAWHPEDRNSQNLPKDDPSEVKTLCPDGEYPSYDAMNYEPEQLTIVRETAPPPVSPPPDPPGAPETPETGDLAQEDPPCPGPNQPRIGTLGPNEKEKVSGYELQPDPNTQGKTICVILYTDIGPVEQFLPSAQVASTTAAIATVAGASALLAKPLADLLLRVFRPAIKQGLTKANAILGRNPYRPSQSEIRSNDYRKKKGLPPLKKPKSK